MYDITDDEYKLIKLKRERDEKKEQIKEIKKEKKLIEFSKKIMFFVMATSFVVILFSMYIIRLTRNTTYLDTLIVETLNFAKIGVGFYSAKACVENVFKNKGDKYEQ